MGVDELSYLLETKRLHLHLVGSFSQNRIDEGLLSSISDNLENVAPVIGDRVDMHKLLVKVIEVP